MILKLIKLTKDVLDFNQSVPLDHIRPYLENLRQDLIFIETLAIAKNPVLPSVCMMNILLGCLIFHVKGIAKDLKRLSIEEKFKAEQSKKNSLLKRELIVVDNLKEIIWDNFVEFQYQSSEEDYINSFKKFYKIYFSQYKLFFQYFWAVDGLLLKNNLLSLPEEEDFVFKLQFNTMYILNAMMPSSNFKKLMEVLNYLDIFIYNKAIMHNVSLTPIQKLIFRRAGIAKYALEIIENDLPDIINIYALCINDLNCFLSLALNSDNSSEFNVNIDNSHAMLFQHFKKTSVVIKKEQETTPEVVEITSRLHELNITSSRIDKPDNHIYSFSFK